MNKSLSPQTIAVLAASLAALLSTILVAFFTKDVLISVLNFLLVFALCYVLFFLLLKEFIYEKIKLIYRSINKYKTQGSTDLVALGKKSNDPLSTVSREVTGWMMENRNEIESLKEQENFRRDFLGNISHELVTPIQSIQGYIHTLLDGALEDKKVNRLFLKKASNSTERLVELVNDLTSINALEGNKAPLKIETFNLVTLCHEVLELVENKTQEKKTKIRLKKTNPKTVMVKADRAKVRQVLVNLIVNAIKYGKKDGNVLVGFYDLDKNILTEITDDGDGIAEEHLPRLFERFYRTDKSRSREEGGSGLGLAIVKHIIEAHNQTVNVRSNLGQGTTFGFTLEKG